MIVLGIDFAMVFHFALNAYAKTLPLSEGHRSPANADASQDGHGDAHGAGDMAAHDEVKYVSPSVEAAPKVVI